LSFIGICIFSFIPAVLGAEAVNHRHIDDYIYGDFPSLYRDGPNNPFGCAGAYAGEGKDGNWLSIWFYPLVFGYEYEGFVLEKVMTDGSLKITVKLKAYDVDVEIYNEIMGPDGYLITDDIVLIGTVDFDFQIVMILDRLFYDLEGNLRVREPGAEIPPAGWVYWYGGFIGAEMVSFRITCIGSGDLMEPGWHWWEDPWPPTPTGETAKIKVDMINLIKPQFKPDHPNTYIGGSGIEMWPVEKIYVF
jgi:hypothetical protein